MLVAGMVYMNTRRTHVVFLLAVLWLCAFGRPTDSVAGKAVGSAQPNAVAGQPAPQSSSSSTHTPTKLALLVGINDYQHPEQVSPLAGSLNDVEDMRQVLIGKFEFPPENILVLKDSQATHAGIIDAIRTHLIAKAQAGDIVVIHYSGHGSQMKDVTGKMISGLDETLVPYDSRDPEGKVFDISGAELHPLLVQLAAKTTNRNHRCRYFQRERIRALRRQ